MKTIILALFLMFGISMVYSKGITLRAFNKPAPEVFRSIAEQTGKNFIYSSELLIKLRVSVTLDNTSLKYSLNEIFKGTDIKWEIKGNNIILKRQQHKSSKSNKVITKPVVRSEKRDTSHIESKMLEEVVVISSNENSKNDLENGGLTLTGDEIRNTQTLLGESDILKSLQQHGGVSARLDDLGDVRVHGGETDQNMIMIENVPTYHISHFGGLFSSINPDAINYVHFYKSYIPSNYNGRLSSFLDVKIRDGNNSKKHGTFRIGLTSGSLCLTGPIDKSTTYLFAVRRSWAELISIPLLAVANSRNEETKTRFRYAFSDMNIKISHKFSTNISAYFTSFYGLDNLHTGSKDKNSERLTQSLNERTDFKWGNGISKIGIVSRINQFTTAELFGAYCYYFSDIKHNIKSLKNTTNGSLESNMLSKFFNINNDWMLQTDFKYTPNIKNNIKFGGNYIYHTFHPKHNSKFYILESTTENRINYYLHNKAHEGNVYFQDNLKISNRFYSNLGGSISLYKIGDKYKLGIAPRILLTYSPHNSMSLQLSYSRTNQFIHKISSSYLSLPTDLWLPISESMKPMKADEIFFEANWHTKDRKYSITFDSYVKAMYNLVDYKDDFYLYTSTGSFYDQLCVGKGFAKGIDINVEKREGKITCRISYSLGWSSRRFSEKNNGKYYPADADTRHIINVAMNWRLNDKIKLSANWIGHSGNRLTLPIQVWEASMSDPFNPGNYIPYKVSLNNYQLPFYHRLDLSCNLYNSNGFWTFGLYNAYCHLNAIGVRRSINQEGKYCFQYVKLLPIIPSISYTWQF
ncbi:MAG: hypothetical protein HDS87_08865 [Bacteroidales bacterium]|nr:hypothetical protein [Bacteroidales bacterium]